MRCTYQREIARVDHGRSAGSRRDLRNGHGNPSERLNVMDVPPLMRLLEGSSAIDAARPAPSPLPRLRRGAPKKRSCALPRLPMALSVESSPGGPIPPVKPRLAHDRSHWKCHRHSKSRRHAHAAQPASRPRSRRRGWEQGLATSAGSGYYVPLAGWLLMDTMSAMIVTTKKFFPAGPKA